MQNFMYEKDAKKNITREDWEAWIESEIFYIAQSEKLKTKI